MHEKKRDTSIKVTGVGMSSVSVGRHFSLDVDPAEYTTVTHNIEAALTDLQHRQAVAAGELAFEISQKIEQLQKDIAKLRPIDVAPGFRLHGFLSTICTKKFKERELDALLADGNAMYIEQLELGSEWGARRVRWTMRGWMLWTVAGGAVGWLMGRLAGRTSKSVD